MMKINIAIIFAVFLLVNTAIFQLNKVWFQKYHVLIFQFLPKNDAHLFLYLSILVCE